MIDSKEYIFTGLLTLNGSDPALPRIGKNSANKTVAYIQEGQAYYDETGHTIENPGVLRVIPHNNDGLIEDYNGKVIGEVQTV